MIKNVIRYILLRIPQDRFPESLERRFFTFEEVAARAHAESNNGGRPTHRWFR